jgi:hypothetical protein
VLTSRKPFPELHTVGFWESYPDRGTVEGFLHSEKLPRLCVVPFRVDDGHVQAIAPAFRACPWIAWAGGEMQDGGDGMRVAVVPEDVYLPNHLDGLHGQPW